MRKHIISRARVLYTNGRKYTYIQNTLRRDLSKASWWYRSYWFSNSIHMSSIPRWKCLSCIQARNTTSFDALAYMYHACNSRILVGSVGINSSHIRGSPNTKVSLFAPRWTLIGTSSSSWAFVRPLSSTNWAVAASFEWGYRLLGLLSELGNFVAPTVTWLLPGLCDLVVVVR